MVYEMVFSSTIAASTVNSWKSGFSWRADFQESVQPNRLSEPYLELSSEYSPKHEQQR